MRECAVEDCKSPVVDPETEDMASVLCYWHYLQGCENDDRRKRMLLAETRRDQRPRPYVGVAFH